MLAPVGGPNAKPRTIEHCSGGHRTTCARGLNDTPSLGYVLQKGHRLTV